MVRLTARMSVRRDPAGPDRKRDRTLSNSGFSPISFPPVLTTLYNLSVLCMLAASQLIIAKKGICELQGVSHTVVIKDLRAMCLLK